VNSGGEDVAVINAALEDVSRKNAGRCDLTVHRPPRILLRTLLIAALALPAASAFAQDVSPLSPKISLQGDRKRPLTPEEQERQKRIDAEYKAATSKIPDQKRSDPWADVRPAPSASAAKKKQQ
jgi:hypothetical protein